MSQQQFNDYSSMTGDMHNRQIIPQGQMTNHGQYHQMPLNQLVAGQKKDSNSNSPHHTSGPGLQSKMKSEGFSNTNNYDHNLQSSSPVPNKMMQPPQHQMSTYSYPINPPIQPIPNSYSQNSIPGITDHPKLPFSSNRPVVNYTQSQPVGQINSNAPPLIPSSQSYPNQPVTSPQFQSREIPPTQPPISMPSQFPGGMYSNPPLCAINPSVSIPALDHENVISPSTTSQLPSGSYPNVSRGTYPLVNVSTHESINRSPIYNNPNLGRQPIPQSSASGLPSHGVSNVPTPSLVNRPPLTVHSGLTSSSPLSQPGKVANASFVSGTIISGPPQSSSFVGPTPSGLINSNFNVSSGPLTMQPHLPSSGPVSGPLASSKPPPQNPSYSNSAYAQSNQPTFQKKYPSNLYQQPNLPVQQMPPFSQMPPIPQMPPMPPIPQMPPMPPIPQMPQIPPASHMPPNQQNVANAHRQPVTQYGAQNLTHQMGQLNVTKTGFDQLWGHQMFDLLQCRPILPEYPEDPPEIRLGHQFSDAPTCSPEIFRCTINRIPETNNLLQKSRLPLGILIHPFKDLNHLPVIQCSTIVRCRACRTYINPYVYFVDAKRWKCNLCYRVNDLPEEFQYDPVSKSYGDPTRRPEIKSATIEFIAPGEYMLRPPQPAVYLFLLDVSQIARESGYLEVFCETMKNCVEQLPGDARTQVGFICYDSHVHYYLMSEGLTRPKEMTVLDIDDVFLPSPESLLVNLGERRELVMDLLEVLPKRHSQPGVPSSALGAALQAAYKLMAPTGGRITVFQTCLPNIGPGALTSREDPNARSSKDVAHLNPATDFYKRLALDCSGAQVAVDLFLINSQYSDLATLCGVSKFSAGSVYHVPLFKSTRSWQADQLRRMLTRYLTRKIGFEAVMRVRCTRGITIHTFHGNFFVRSTDLLSLPNVSPDSGFGMQLTIEESLSDVQQVCFQAALLYTSSKGERRIRVHTLCLPIANNLTDVLHAADQYCIIGLLSKMAVDRAASASMSEAREALINVAVDALSAHRLAQNLPAGSASPTLHAPACLRLLPLFLLGLLKHKAFRTGISTRLDDRVAAMCDMKSLPLSQLMRSIYPDLYPLHNLGDYIPENSPHDGEEEEEPCPDPPRLHLSAERVNTTGAYLLDDGETMIIYVGHAVSAAFLSDTLGVTSFNQIPDEAHALPRLEGENNTLLHSFIDKLNDERPFASNILIIRDNSPSRLLFTERLVDDRVETAFSYYEFLQHIKNQVK